VVGSEGPIVESDLVKALKDIKEVARRHRDGEPGGHPIDVLSLSLGYYHETPQDELFDPTMYDILRELGECGVSVVCSAGNDATDRLMFPAAWCPWLGDSTIVPADTTAVPIVAVGALNPNGTTALFSNSGPWVRAHAPGAAVMSTLPPFQGGLQPMARLVLEGETRESIDPDDYRGQFALWSGTSFAAPLFAGRVAAQLLGHLDPSHDTRADAVSRGWRAVAALTGIRP
jgi:subtilisin family serine protease